MRKFIFLIGGFLLLAGFVSDDFMKVKVTDDIAVFVPSSFVPLPQEQIDRRQLSHRKPLLFYTDANNEVNFTVNMSYSLFGKNDFELLKSFYKSSLMNLYDEVNFIKDEVVEVNDHKFALFEFESRVRGDEDSFVMQDDMKTYTLIMYTVLDNNNTVLISFSCPLRSEERWQTMAHEIMNRVEVK